MKDKISYIKSKEITSTQTHITLLDLCWQDSAVLLPVESSLKSGVDKGHGTPKTPHWLFCYLNIPLYLWKRQSRLSLSVTHWSNLNELH